jgi:iron-sulfur cluster assembly protein
MTIRLTESAAKQIQAQLAKRGKGVGLRVGVKKIGCSGWGYTYDFADALNAEDQAFDAHGARVVVDKEALAFLDGSTVDFVREGLKQVYRIENPNVDATCGCGESFSVKEKA